MSFAMGTFSAPLKDRRTSTPVTLSAPSTPPRTQTPKEKKPSVKSTAMTNYSASSLQMEDRFIPSKIGKSDFQCEPSALSNTSQKRLSLSEMSMAKEDRDNAGPVNSRAVSETSSIVKDDAEYAKSIIKRTPSQTQSLDSVFQSLISCHERFRMPESKYYRTERSITPDSISVKSHNSFAVRAIDQLIEHNPALRVELEGLKKSITDHEDALHQDKRITEKKLQHQIRTLLEITELNDGKITEQRDLIAILYRRVDARDAEMKAAQEELQGALKRSMQLELANNQKDREYDIQRRDHASALRRLEREKRGFVEQIALIEDQIETERARADSQTNMKDKAMRTNDGMRQHFDFYRNYYDQQDALYRAYFKDHSDMSGSGQTKQAAALPTICEEKSMDMMDSAIKQAADTLRERYRSMLEAGTGDERIRGFEFLALLEKSLAKIDLEAKNTLENTAKHAEGSTKNAQEINEETDTKAGCSF